MKKLLINLLLDIEINVSTCIHFLPKLAKNIFFYTGDRVTFKTVV